MKTRMVSSKKEKRYFSMTEASRELGMSRQAIHEAILQKRLKAKKGTFVVRRMVETKMKGWVIEEKDLRAFQVSERHQMAGKGESSKEDA